MKHRSCSRFTALASALVLLMIAMTSAHAQNLREFSYQGIAKQNGSAVTGTHQVYMLLTNNAGNQPYRETQMVQFGENGEFNIVVGYPNGIPSSLDFSSQQFLSISIDKDSNYLMPPTAIVSAPSAIVAGTVTDGAITTSKLAGGAVTLSKLSATGSAGVLTSDGSTLSWQSLGGSGNGGYPVQGSLVPFADASPRAGYTYIGPGDSLGNKWSSISPLNLTQFFSSSSVQVGDTIYAIAHSLQDATRYVTGTQKIALPSGIVTKGADLPQAIGASAVAVWNRKIYVIGGGTAPSGPYIVPLVFVYNTATGSTGSVNNSGWTGRAYASAITTGDSIWVLGGKTNSGPVTNIDVFNPQNESWRRTNSNLAMAVDGAFYGTDGAHIYILGGVTSTGVNYTGIQTLDLATGTVTAQTGVFPASAFGASVTYNGKIYMFGGTDSVNHNLNRVLIFDMTTRQLTTGAPLQVGRQIPAAGVWNNQFYVFGGYVISGTLGDGASYAPPFAIHWFRKD